MRALHQAVHTDIVGSNVFILNLNIKNIHARTSFIYVTIKLTLQSVAKDGRVQI